MSQPSYFPILILLVKENKKMVCKTVDDIPSGITFKVLETNYAAAN